MMPKQKGPSSSKTVMSLLRESQSEGSGDHRSYMKDSRPVARILKEERERKQATSTMDAGSTTAALASWSSSLEGVHLTEPEQGRT
jgi:hypothetical protein